MTEEEWIKSDDPDEMLSHLARSYGRSLTPNERSLRLFAAAAVRHAQEPFADDLVRQAVEIVEHFADARTNEERKLIKQARRIAHELFLAEHRVERGNYIDPVTSGYYLLDGLVRISVLDAAEEVLSRTMTYEREVGRDIRNGRVLRSRVLRDIVGNPFRAKSLTPAWRTSTAVALAKQMYEYRDFAIMPILGDALQDAGCDNDDILSHCRDPQAAHVRGCWVVDLVLGKS